MKLLQGKRRYDILGNSIGEYSDIKYNKYSKLLWIEENSKYSGFEKSEFQFRRNNTSYHVKITLFHTEKHIEIVSNSLVELEQLYLLIGEIRRYEYLFDGAFYILRKCTVDDEDITNVIGKAEVGYFQNAGYKHKIPLDLNDKEYKKYFLRWIAVEKKLGIISQMVLYANNVRGIPADVRMAMLAECYESLAKNLKRKGLIRIIPEPDTNRLVYCPNCKQEHGINISGKVTLACCLSAILENYGKPVFTTEYRRRKSLVKRIVKTRNKVFHVNNRQKKTLKGSNSGFYVIKLEWMYRYIVWLLMGFDRGRLDEIVSKQILKFEHDFPDLIYVR